MPPTALQPVRGTRDLIGEEQRRHQRVVDAARRTAALYGFEEWATPVFEDTRVFARGLGDTSDVVSKEMYTFTDRGGDSVTLRPENTAGVCRALVSNGLAQAGLPRKVFYAGPMFRYERPQKGRYRQFHQIGIEVLGAAEPLADAECIACGWHIQQGLGIDAGTVLEVNTLGDAESAAAYRAALVAYFTGHKDRLSADSRVRLEKNPLRILDSKDPKDKALVAGAPTIHDHLTAEAAGFYAAVDAKAWAQVEALLADPGIIRNRRKIEAAVANAQAVVGMRGERFAPLHPGSPGAGPAWHGDGDRPVCGLPGLVWAHQPAATPRPETVAQVPSTSDESRALARALKAHGCRFVGPTTCFALLEAAGIVDTHLLGSWRRGASGIWE